ncbi:hypothetical protein HMPREF9554_00375 [Treponema phagedenis F0421]|nr:hypothetical protein HMPREF9554_00375 [Treponema phagedenis F0421]
MLSVKQKTLPEVSSILDTVIFHTDTNHQKFYKKKSDTAQR